MNPLRVMLAAVAASLAMVAMRPVAAQTTATAKPQAPRQQQQALIDHGRYLIKVSGCNDCHTPGYGPAAGKVDEKLWLTGDSLGWRGAWGTTYPTNLRLYMQSHSEASWLQTARTFQPRPPMPWFNVHAMSDRDLRAIYHYVRALGPAGQPAPAYVPPGQEPAGPVVSFPG
jgi:mono/diheme cytochrome c family protein